MSDWTVKIEYKNKNLETVVEKEYDFISYTEMLNLELMRLIMEIDWTNEEKNVGIIGLEDLSHHYQ